MTPVSAYFFGILSVFLILIPFWFVSTINDTIKTTYKNSICYGICNNAGSPGLGLGDTQN